MSCNDFERSFSEKSKRMLFVGHMLIAAPHPITLCVGLLIAGLGWLYSRSKIRYITGPILIVFSLLLGAILWQLWFITPSRFFYDYLSEELAPLVSITFVIGIATYGLLMTALFNLGRKYDIALFRCAATSFAFTVIVTFFAASLLVLSASRNPVITPSGFPIVLTTFELSLLSAVTLNFLGNLLAGIGFIRRRK